MNERPIVDTNCDACAISTGKAISGAGPLDLSKIKLVIVSDTMSYYDEEEGKAFVSNDKYRKPRRLKSGKLTIEKPRNGASFMRYELQKLGLDPDIDCWMTNIIKCHPGKVRPKDKEAKQCARKWFADELTILGLYNPTVPILIAGNIAFKAIKNIYRDCSFAPYNLKQCFRTDHHTLINHPVFFTANPATVSSTEWSVEDTVMIDQNNRAEVVSKKTITPPIFSPIWIYEKDLEPLDKFLNPDKFSISSAILF